MNKLTIKPELKISIIYIIIGCAWILGSGKIVITLFDDIHTINLIETYKGWLFVITTGFLLYLLIKKEISKRNRIMKDLRISKKQAEEASKLKSAFILNMSHEIRTPLNAVLGFSDILNEKNLTPEKTKKYTTYIKQRGSDLLNIIDDLLDISRIESDSFKLYNEEFYIHELLDELKKYATELLSDYPEKQIEIKLEENRNKELKLFADRKRMKQIYKSLLNNAIKFTERGFIQFGYQLNDKSMILFVEDTGVGIPENKTNHIFESFLQLDPSLTRKHGGLGIGLSLTKKLAEKLGGTIKVESTIDKGSKFTIELPIPIFQEN